MFENPRRGRQARNFTTNVPKIVDLKSSPEQIFSENCRWVPLMFEKKLKMAGDKNKHTICALLLSLLALTTSFQQNYHNNQLMVTPNEMVGLYCPD